MDNIISRFPGLAEKIFDCLDDESLVNSRTVSRTWSEFTEDEMFFSRRTIEKLIGGYEDFYAADFKETWKLVMKKADKEMTKEMALAVKFFLSKHPGNCIFDDCNHRTLSLAPLHIGAEAGQATLCEFILQITKDKNPRNEDGWTPLHEAAVLGHLSICEMIMNEIEEKNPRANGGRTPLLAAAEGGHLETFKMILDKAGTNINPSDNEGWTALHWAASNGDKEMCKFIGDQLDEKNPETNYGLTPQKLMWDSIF